MSVVDVLLVKCHRFYVKNVHFPQKKSENVAEMYIAKCSPIVHKLSSFSCNQDQTNFKNSFRGSPTRRTPLECDLLEGGNAAQFFVGPSSSQVAPLALGRGPREESPRGSGGKGEGGQG